VYDEEYETEIEKETEIEDDEEKENERIYSELELESDDELSKVCSSDDEALQEIDFEDFDEWLEEDE